jgi:hypothetical protein
MGRSDAHVHAVYKGRHVDVIVHPSPAGPGGHIVVVVHEEAPGAQDRRAEYVTSDSRLDEALNAGLEAGRAMVDGRMH